MKTRTWLILFGFLIAIPVGWYLISPLFINKTVNEDFPAVQAAEVMEDKTVISSDAEMDETMDDEMTEPSPTIDDAAMPDPTPTTIDEGISDPMPEDEMTILFQGEFYNLAHEGMGTATLYQLADGSRLLRFENFEVLNGPDLHVYLAPQDPIPNTVGLELDGSLDLGKLKGNLGAQNYEIPADLDLSLYKSVVIWCQPFRVPFNAASLQVP